jgi:protocatechuate 3,4-dioxygenase beta subunit
MTTPLLPASPLGRRRALQLLGGAGLAALVGCASRDGSTATASTSTTSTTASASTSTTAAAAADAMPEETAGPYPGDGTNWPDVLTQDGVVRSDITTSFGSSTTTAAGVPLTIRLLLQEASSGQARGGAVYLWHCDREGRYSLYSPGVEGENYLRGVQEADGDGVVTFTSIFPAAYSGRWPHIHFEVYDSVADATGGGRPAATSQVALPEDICDQVYATDGYDQSVRNLSQTSLENDNVFGDDDGVHQLATISGDVTSGITAELAVPV